VLFLARHGQVDPSWQGRWLGRTDVPLSEAGEREADDLATFMLRRRISVHRIYSSPRRRAFDTACRVGESLQAPVAVAEALDEMDLGSVEGRRPEDLHGAEREAWRYYLEDIYLHPVPGGEAFRQLEARVLRFARQIEADGKDALLVTHTGPLLALACHALGLDPRLRPRLTIETGSLSAITLTPPAVLLLNEKPAFVHRPPELCIRDA
jgi:broad specificity phosphatase PhoE